MSRTTLFFGHRFFDRRFTARIAEEAQNGLLQFAVVALAQRIHDLGEPLGHERRIRPGGKFRRHEERTRHAFDDAVPGRGDKLRPEVAEFLGGFAFVRGPGDAVDDFLQLREDRGRHAFGPLFGYGFPSTSTPTRSTWVLSKIRASSSKRVLVYGILPS